ncbi:MAG: PAS domain S-box protein [Balneolales bacterium]|nr:PAS domain S-box protein [Balneolales bacterium]
MDKLYNLQTDITEILSQNYTREESIRLTMQTLLDYSDVCRVYFFELIPSEEYGYLGSQLFEVCAQGVKPEIDNPELQNVPMMPYFEPWINAFNKNQPYFGDVEEFPEVEKEVLESQGIISIIVLPVFWDKKLVGFIGFDETKRKREWTKDEVQLLDRSSQLLGRLMAAHSVDLALERKNTDFKQLVDAMPTGYIELDMHRIITSWNASAQKMFGYQEEEVFGRPIDLLTNGVSLISAKLYDEAESICDTEVAESSTNNNENKHYRDTVRILHAKRKDGVVICVRWNIRILIGANAKVSKYIVLTQDITEELAQAAKLRDSEERYRNLYERMNDGVVYRDNNGKGTQANSAACKLLGLSYNQITGVEPYHDGWQSIGENGKPISFDDYPATVALQTGETVENVVMGINSPVSDRTRWINVTATPEYRDGEEKPYRVFTIFRDVTDSIELKNKLLAQQAKFLEYAKTLSIGVWFRDEQGNLTFVNEALADIFGVHKEQFYEKGGDKYSDYIHPDDRDYVLNMQKVHYEEKKSVKAEFRIIRPDGTERWVHVKQIYIATPFSEEPTSAGYMNDITEQKIKMETLIAAKASAESLSALRNGIIETISHEFRTPITSIMGFTTLIQSVLDDEELINYALMVQESANRLHRTLESVLSYASLVAENAVMRTDRFDLKLVLSAILQEKTAQAEEKGIYFQHFVPDNLIIFSDESLIKSIVDQLLDNAVKFTKDGGVRLHVKAIGKNLNIEVIDTGIGLPDNVDLSIYEPFRQFSEGISRLYDGIGMGLPIVSKQVELLRGTIKWKNNEFDGCSFNITLPLAMETMMNDITNEESSVSRSSDLRILYVEDNLLLQILMKKKFAEFNIKVVTTPEEAIAEIESSKYDVFMLDINLNHELTGIDICNMIRQHKNQKEAYVVAVTAMSREKIEPYIGEDGFNEHFLKPFDYNILRQKMLQNFGLET